METKSNKTIVLECYRKIIRDLDLSLIDQYIHEDYIQHSPTVKTGRAGITEMLTFMQTLPKSKEAAPSPIVRCIAEGDLVAIHLDVVFMGKRFAVIDLMRLENGKMAEHWDVGQAQPLITDSRITMTNGISVIEYSASTNDNKALINSFYEHVKRAGADINSYFTNGFIEHNIELPLLNIVGENIKVHRVISEGNFVVTHCEIMKDDKTFAQFNIFKIEDGKIAEHWSVEQEVPDIMAHNNGMF